MLPWWLEKAFQNALRSSFSAFDINPDTWEVASKD
jgi:hypothetical protein